MRQRATPGLTSISSICNLSSIFLYVLNENVGEGLRSHIELPINALGAAIYDGLGYMTVVAMYLLNIRTSFSLSLLLEKVG